jgi:hypothetical protein
VLIDLLKDKEPIVVRAAHAALKALSGVDHGADADAIPAWKAWWDKEKGK